MRHFFYLQCGVREVMVKFFKLAALQLEIQKVLRPYIQFFK